MIDEDDPVDKDEEWDHDEDGFNRLLIAGFKCKIGHPNVTNDELRLMQDEALRDRWVD